MTVLWFFEGSEIIEMCEQFGYYTAGSVEEYSTMLNKATSHKAKRRGLTADEVAEVAKDIWEHSTEDCNGVKSDVRYITERLLNRGYAALG